MSAPPEPARSPPPGRRSWLLWSGLVLLHGLTFCGLFQSGFTREEVHALVPPGPYKLIAPYVAAAHRDGPIGLIRVYYFGESDDRLYLEYARLLLDGTVDVAHVEKVQRRAATHDALPPRPWPYRDVTLEYPPLALLAITPPALFSTDYAGYRRVFAAWMLLLHLGNLALAYRLLRPTLQPARRIHPITWLLFASLIGSLLLGRISAARMDHVVVSWSLGCLWAGDRALRAEGRSRLHWAALSGVLAACGVMTKLVPGLALLALLVIWLDSKLADRFRLAGAALAAGGLTLIAINVPMFAFAGERYLDTFRYHTLRGVQIESFYAGVLLLLRPLIPPLGLSEAFGSTNLESCFTPAIKLISPWLFLAACGVICARRYRPEPRALICATCALFLGFVITGRVFSPQYLIWLAAPLLAAAALDRSRGRFRMCAALFLGLCAISQLIYPQGYPVLKAFHPLAIALLNLRNVGIVGLCVLLVRAGSSARAQRNT
jgi:4-amino-4-deoxy-L-arabinose transferase-like glycosyltransferase